MYRFHQLNSSSWLLLWTQLLHTKKELACAIINKFFWGSEVHDERELSVQWWWWRKVKLSSTQRADVGVAPTGAIHNDTVGRLEFFFFFLFFLENGDPKDRSTCSVSQHVSIYSSFRLVFYCFIYFQNASLLQDASPVCFNNKASIVYVTDNGL